MVERVAEAGGLRHLRRTRSGHPVGGQTVLEVFGAAGGPPRLAETDEEEENACCGDDPEHEWGREGYGWHLILQKGQYSLSGGGWGVG